MRPDSDCDERIFSLTLFTVFYGPTLGQQTIEHLEGKENRREILTVSSCSTYFTIYLSSAWFIYKTTLYTKSSKINSVVCLFVFLNHISTGGESPPERTNNWLKVTFQTLEILRNYFWISSNQLQTPEEYFFYTRDWNFLCLWVKLKDFCLIFNIFNPRSSRRNRLRISTSAVSNRLNQNDSIKDFSWYYCGKKSAVWHLFVQ